MRYAYTYTFGVDESFTYIRQHGSAVYVGMVVVVCIP